MVRKFGLLALLTGLCFSLMGSAYPFAQEAEPVGTRWWIWVLIALVLLAFAAYVIWWWLNPKEEKAEALTRVEGVELPKVQVPAAELPKVTVPAVELPKVELPEVKLPEVEAPELPAIASKAAAVVDDLKVIEGIGPKISSVLNAAGIASFAQLAGLTPQRILEILEKADPRLLRLADPATWPEQARLAAAGDWEALRTLTDQLKGGRKA
jgi:predicted flap endonuclease-1-like 5' DNA nuclease